MGGGMGGGRGVGRGVGREVDGGGKEEAVRGGRRGEEGLGWVLVGTGSNQG